MTELRQKTSSSENLFIIQNNSRNIGRKKNCKQLLKSYINEGIKEEAYKQYSDDGFA